MKYYPVYLEIRDKRCVVIGGGDVAERKAVSLLEAGADVTVVSPSLTGDLKELLASGKIKAVNRPYTEGDLKGAFLAFAATDEEDINKGIADEAEREGVLLNVADDPEKCGFIVPSIVERGDLLISISTSGASPAFAKRLRIDLEKMYGGEYAVFLDIMRAARALLLTKGRGDDKSRKIFNKLASSSIPEMIRDGRWEEVEKILVSLLGEGFSLKSLGIKRP